MHGGRGQRGGSGRRMQPTTDLQVDGRHAVLCRPAGGARAGLLLLPMVYVVERKVLEYARWLADAGFAALVWDPYSGRDVPTGPPEVMAPLARSLRDAAVRAEQERWLRYLRQEQQLARVGLIGWCVGGRFALLLAAQSAAVAACV